MLVSWIVVDGFASEWLKEGIFLASGRYSVSDALTVGVLCAALAGLGAYLAVLLIARSANPVLWSIPTVVFAATLVSNLWGLGESIGGTPMGNLVYGQSFLVPAGTALGAFAATVVNRAHTVRQTSPTSGCA